MGEHAIVAVETYADLTLRQENYVRNNKRWFLCLLPTTKEMHLVIGTNNVFSSSFSYSTGFSGMYHISVSRCPKWAIPGGETRECNFLSSVRVPLIQ